MSRYRQLRKWTWRIALIPVLYLAIALVTSFIPVGNSSMTKLFRNKCVYLSTNGVHLSIQIPVADMPKRFAGSLLRGNKAELIGFGWGDEGFLLNVPTWADLDVSTAVTATLLPTPSLMHVSLWQSKQSWMVPVHLSEDQLNALIAEIEASFSMSRGAPIFMLHPGFSDNDNFYKSPLNYHALHTCNSWVNNCFKKAGLDACLWTPFDFGVMRRYEN